MMRRAAVFGIAGFSGRHFERYVVEAGLNREFEFFGFAKDLHRVEESGAFSYHCGDACKLIHVSEFLTNIQPTYVLNLTGIFRADTFGELLSINLGISRVICEAVRNSSLKVEKIVLVGSAAEYGYPVHNPVPEDADLRPVSDYGLTKLYQTILGEYFFRNYGLPIVVARTFNLLGEGLSPQLSVGNFMRQIVMLPNGGVIKAGNLSTSRDFLDVSEVSRRYWQLLIKGTPGDVYNICSGTPRTVRSILEDLVLRSGKTLDIQADPSLFKENDIDSIYGDGTKYEERIG